MPEDQTHGTVANDIDPARIAFGLMGATLGTVADTTPEAVFLADAARDMGPVSLANDCLAAALERAPSNALLRLAQSLDFTPFDLAAIAICLAVETDAIAGRAVAYMQAPVGGARPTPGLLATVLRPLAGGEGGVPALVSGPPVATGVLSLSEKGPMPERAMQMPEGLAACLSSGALSWPGLTRTPGKTDPNWPPSLVSALARMANGLKGANPPVLVIRNAARSDRDEISARLGEALGQRAAIFDLGRVRRDGLGAFVLAGALLPVFEGETGPGDTAMLPELAGYAGPSLVFLGPEGGFSSPGRSAIDWSLPLPEAEERASLWASSFPDPDLCAHLGREHLQGAGRIGEICRAAEAEARLRGADVPDANALRAAIWVSDGGGLGSLAQPVRDTIPDDAMITGPALRRDLGFLLARCRAREKLTEGLGGALKTRYKVGVRSLFAGPSGTGKTLAAAWLAGKLTLPLYRVDLAAVSSKYIGETEKNLSQLLAKAEEQDLVLLFDEADSLFGKRTEINDSNDRFANAQTNYLLQRIESFTGIVVLTSNAKNRFDEAFTRRIDAIIDFLQPEAAERIALWRAHLGAGHGLSAQELNRLAAFADITGGHIRNVVLMAAVLARESVAPIGYSHVLEGLKSEYRKLGMTVPSELLILRGVA